MGSDASIVKVYVTPAPADRNDIACALEAGTSVCGGHRDRELGATKLIADLLYGVPPTDVIGAPKRVVIR